MNAALCCPGPSLLDTFPSRDDFDCIACVNRAGAAIAPDYWVALDLPRILESSPGVSACKLLTNAETLASLKRRGHFRASGVVTTVESLCDLCPVPQWPLYSATAGLVLLTHLSATSVRVYGADWSTGAPDFDGVSAGENRGAERFAWERHIWNAVVAWMSSLGIAVERITPEVAGARCNPN
jgi:hypothetical protein